MRPYLTEEEAKGKKCPVMTYCYNPHQVSDGECAMYQNSNCIGSDCMWWGTSDDLARVDRRGITPLGRCEAPGGAA